MSTVMMNGQAYTLTEAMPRLSIEMLSCMEDLLAEHEEYEMAAIIRDEIRARIRRSWRERIFQWLKR
jgi:protein-arginine kinase activator protein McsA